MSSCLQTVCVVALSLCSQAGGREVEVTFVGDLTKTDHDVGGKVYILDQNTLVIDQFSYDGNGFGVYINVATRGKTLKAFAKNRIDIAYPSGSEVYIHLNKQLHHLVDTFTRGNP